MDRQLLTSKLTMPHTGSNYVSRPRLLQLLSQLETRKLTVVEASAGSGKSMLIADYFQQQNKTKQVVWLNLTADWQAPDLFWSYVFEGLKPYFKIKDEQELSLLQSQYTTQTVTELLIFMLNQLEESAFYFVIDDLHLLTEAALLKDLEFFIKELPTTVHCVLLSRRRVPFFQAQWHLNQDLLVISQQDLALTESEGMSFMTHANVTGITEAEQRRFWQFSEGWLGGLQLLLAGQSQNSVHTLKQEGGDKVLVYDYLRQELYNRFPTDLKKFLLVTVQFAYFDEALCRKLFPEKSFSQWLMELEKHSVMLQNLSFERQTYRYHHLFEEFFLKESHQLTKPVLEEYIQQGLPVFVAQGDLDESINLALKLTDYPLAMDLILQLEQPLQLFFYMKKVPNKVITENFSFTLQKFFFHYMNSERAACIEIHQLALEKIPADSQFKVFKGMEYLVGEQQVVFEIPVLSTEMIQRLQASEMTKALMMIRNVSVLFYQCRYQEGLTQVRYNQELSQRLKSDYLTFFNLNIEAQLLEEMGYLNKSLVVYQQINDLIARSTILPQLSTSFDLSYQISILGTYLKQMDLRATAEIFANIAKGDLDVIHGDAHLYNQVEYWYLLGEKEKAWQGLAQLLASPIFENRVVIASLLKYAFKEGQMSKKLQAEFKQQVSTTATFHYNAQLLYGKILFGEGKSEEALEVMDRFLIKSRKDKVPLKIIEGSLLKIKCILSDPHRQKEAQDLYREAIFYGCDDRIKQAFFFEQEVLKELFQRDYETLEASLTGVELAFHQELVREWDLIVTNPLTERETEVLMEIAKSQTNKQIAGKLFISEATVKTHILNVYRKLEVNSRVAAVEKGQQLNIL